MHNGVRHLFRAACFSPSVKSAHRVKLVCTLSSPGTCRVDRNCYCPGAFLEHYDSRKSYGVWNNCESSFSEKYPDSIGKEDVDWRSCKKGAQVTDFGSKSCCELTEDELQAAAGTSDLCPTNIQVASIDKCETCPPGK